MVLVKVAGIIFEAICPKNFWGEKCLSFYFSPKKLGAGSNISWFQTRRLRDVFNPI